MKKAPLPSKIGSYIPFIIYIVVLVLLMPRAPKFEYEYKSGSPWKYETLVSEFDFPIYKTAEQMMKERAEAEKRAVPYFRCSDEASARALARLDETDLGPADSMRAAMTAEFRRLYDQGIMQDDFTKANKLLALSEDLIYVQKGKRAAKYPVSGVYKLSAAKSGFRTRMKELYPDAAVDSLLDASALVDYLEPNLVFDRQMTELVHSDEDLDISPTQGFVAAGTVIVSEGEIVTAEVAQMLDSYKTEYESNMDADTPSSLIWISNIILALFLTMILFWIIYYADPGVFSRKGELYYIVFVSLLAAVTTLILVKFDLEEMVFLVPFTITALYLQAFFPNRTIVPVYLVALLPLALFMPQGVALYVLYALSGMIAIKMFDHFNRGFKQFVTAIVVFAIVSCGYLAMRYSGMLSGVVLRDVTYILISSLLSVAFYQLIFLFERVFGLLSVPKLEELTDTNSKLLRALELKAPGTFQHSLQVMSMADAAARAIGADEYLVRAGAMYHDIGKMNNPQCFIENESLSQSGEESGGYHNGLSPIQSAKDITRHVTDGIDIARQERLPEPVAKFIETHHGDNLVRSFYYKYLNEGGDPANEAEFKYQGSRPVTKEQVILMLCDSIEAASRTLKEHTPKSFSDFVESIVGAKIDEGQLSEADITVKELNTVKEVLKNYLAQIYHERTVYPKRKR